jgi:hypothetical protein
LRMYEHLYQYFILYKQLTIPGIGTFVLERKAAENDFLSKQFLAPSYSVLLQTSGRVPAQKFFNWLAASINTSHREAFEQFNEFVSETKKQIELGKKVEWDGIGTISSGMGGAIKFSPAQLFSDETVKAEKIIRQNAEHTVRVGEQEKTSVEMMAMLSHPREKRSYWWPAAVILLILGIFFTGWYVVRNGLKAASVANEKKLTPEESSQRYKLVQ